ncbi:MAG: DNA-binding protein [Methanosarcinaceae archaeon]|nr:DNA-binding protein [Methanosarcinaceae archaeon]
MKVIIDTNGLMIPVQFKVDIFNELKRLGFDEFLVPEAVIDELDMLTKRSKGADRTAAKVARSLIDMCEVANVRGVADDVIAKLAVDLGAAVLTNDIELKKRLSDINITVVYLRQKNMLAMT